MSDPTPQPNGGIRNLPVIGHVVNFVAPKRNSKVKGWRRAVSWTTGVVIVLGGLMVMYPFLGQHYPGFIRIPVEKGIEWSNFFSDLESNKIQDRLDGKIKSQAMANKLRSRSIGEGDPITRIRIPKIGLDMVVVEGVSESALKAGAGHYPTTPLPGEQGNVAMAGHRTTYGRPFNRVDELAVGDKILLTTPLGTFTYEVSRAPFTVAPTDLSVLDKSTDSLLTLTTCHPKGSAKQRLIIRAKLADGAKSSKRSVAA